MHKHSYLLLHTPPFLHDFVRHYLAPIEAGDLEPPRDVPELYNARWAGSWELPGIQPPEGFRKGEQSKVSQEPGMAANGAWLALYIFSTSSSRSRARRALIRSYHPLDSLPPSLRSLVSVKFVLGYPNTDVPEDVNATAYKAEQAKEEEAIQAEQYVHYDLVRLEGLVHGENMNEGKAVDWLKWAGSEGNEAQWIFKCDDDTFVLLPNLLDDLLKLDPSQPTYLGSSTGHWPGHLWYYTGMMYGFSWGVARTITTSGTHKEVYTQPLHEDVLMGELMYLLPSKPLCDSVDHYYPAARTRFHSAHALGLFPSPSVTPTCLASPIRYDTPPPGGWNSPPPSPERRTGLVRVDFEGKMGGQGMWDWWVHGPDKAVAWHPNKDNQQYIDSYHRAKDYFIGKYGKYEWVPPKGWEDQLVWAD